MLFVVEYRRFGLIRLYAEAMTFAEATRIANEVANDAVIREARPHEQRRVDVVNRAGEVEVTLWYTSGQAAREGASLWDDDQDYFARLLPDDRLAVWAIQPGRRVTKMGEYDSIAEAHAIADTFTIDDTYAIALPVGMGNLSLALSEKTA